MNKQQVQHNSYKYTFHCCEYEICRHVALDFATRHNVTFCNLIELASKPETHFETG